MPDRRPATPQAIPRVASTHADYLAVRDLLVRTYPTTPLGANWDVRRWDGKRYYDSQPEWDPDYGCRVCLWVTPQGRAVAAVHPEGEGDAFFQLEPGFEDLQPALLDWAETHLASAEADGSRQLAVEALAGDADRQALLRSRGYEPIGAGSVTRRRRVSEAAAERRALPAGYSSRATNPHRVAECRAVASLIAAAFGSPSHDHLAYQGFCLRCPAFVPQLDLLALAPNGDPAAYVGVTWDGANRRGMLEPVCTHPDHRRLGLARHLIEEAVGRLRALGGRELTVGTGDMEAANRLYDSAGFGEASRSQVWRKSW